LNVKTQGEFQLHSHTYCKLVLRMAVQMPGEQAAFCRGQIKVTYT